MENQKNIKPRAYAFYSFIDAETVKKYDERNYTFEPTLVVKHKAIKNLLNYAFKQYYDIDVNGANILKYQSSGVYCFDGIYFSRSVCVCAIAVTVSPCPTGVDIQIPHPVDEEESANYYFCDNEREEYNRRKYGDDTLFYMQCKKQAFIKKYNPEYQNISEVDSTAQSAYTLHKDTFLDAPYLFAATDDVEFIKVPVEIVLP